MRVLGVDFGPRQIGLAVSDETGFLARPLRSFSVERIREAPEAVAAVAREEEADAIVVGMPVGLEGEEHRPESHRVLRFAKALRAATGLPVHLEDESLSSREARELPSGHRRGARGAAEREHSRAAAIVLQRWLDARAAGPHTPPHGREGEGA
ncbi:MAG TPA: Holliday junction resolvase RuvX [Candidatus Eisenbacteria bacterium]